MSPKEGTGNKSKSYCVLLDKFAGRCNNHLNAKAETTKGKIMGYTHYYQRSLDSNDPELYDKVRKGFTELVKNAELNGITVADAFGEKAGAWQADGERIAFNGLGEKSCETFSFSQIVPPQPHWRANEKTFFDFTKTEYRPYDALVCATLILIKEVYGSQVEVSSDGGWEDWADGYELYYSTFKNPMTPEKLFAEELAFLAGK